jgi:hypothetical protein
MSDRPDLAGEYSNALQNARIERYAQRLAQLGFSHVARRCCGMAGVARVAWHEGYRAESDVYEPDPHGSVMAVILPSGAKLEDLVAWDTQGKRLASRTGSVFALGESWLSGDCASVKVYTDPSEWWRACVAAPVALWPDARLDRDLTEDAWPYSPLDRFWWHPPGLVLIDWNDARHRLGHVKRLIADRLDLAERLERAVEPLPVEHPQIFVDAERLAA